MHERERRARRDDPERRRAEPPRPDPRLAQLLRMQQSAGNQAVMRMYFPPTKEEEEEEEREKAKDPSPWSALDWVNPRFYLPESVGGYSDREASVRGNPEPKFGGTFPEEIVPVFKRSFRIVDPGKKARKPDEVTREEYDETAQLVGDVWRGSSGIAIDLNAVEESDDPRGRERELKLAVIKDVIEIARTVTGRALLGMVAYAAREVKVTIRAVDAVVEPTAAPTERGTKSERERQKSAVTYTPTEFKAKKGKYAQQNIDKVEQHKANNPWLMPRRSDISLYHELVHAFHIQNGRLKGSDSLVGTPGRPTAVHDVDKPYTKQDSFGVTTTRGVSEEEYFTVGLGQYRNARFSENKYRGERRDMGEDVPDRDTYTTMDENGEPVREKQEL